MTRSQTKRGLEEVFGGAERIMQRIDRVSNLEQPVGRFYPEIALLNSLNRNHLVQAGAAWITECGSI